MNGPLTTTDLVIAAARGDQSAWDQIVRQYLPLVMAVVRGYRLSAKDAEDVSQTVWLRLVENLESIREPRALPRWISTTTKNEALRVVTARKRMLPVDPQTGTALEPDVEQHDTDEDLLRAERQQVLRDGLAELAPEHRQLLLLLVADPPVSYAEISAQLGMPVGSIGPTRARCLARLRSTSALRDFMGSDGGSGLTGGGHHELSSVG